MDARPALASKSIELTKDSIERYVSSISGLFLNGLVKKVEARIKLHIFQTARFFVCTAASAVKLPMRVENELDGLGDLRLPEAADEDGLGGIVSKLAHVSVADSTDDDTTAQKSLLAKLLDFKHVVLDEAGAMLEPDMVVRFKPPWSARPQPHDAHMPHIEAPLNLVAVAYNCWLC